MSQIKVRPFKTTVNNIHIEGLIQGEQLRLRFFRRTYPVTTSQVGIDKHGQYALVGEMERSVDFGYMLKIEPDYDEDLPAGCRIAIVRDQTDSFRATLEQEGINPDSVNLVGTFSESASVYFDCGGNMEGESHLEPAPLDAGDYDM